MKRPLRGLLSVALALVEWRRQSGWVYTLKVLLRRNMISLILLVLLLVRYSCPYLV